MNSELLRGERDLTVAAGNGASGCDRVSDVEGDGSSWGVGKLGENGSRSWLLYCGLGTEGVVVVAMKVYFHCEQRLVSASARAAKK